MATLPWGSFKWSQEIHTPSYPGNNVQEIKRLLDIAMKGICDTYWNSRHTFLFSVEQSVLAKKFLLKKAAQQVSTDFPNTNSLALLEAVNDLSEEIK